MVVTVWELELDVAYEYDVNGNYDTPITLYARGGHYYDAFARAAVRWLLSEKRRVTVSDGLIRNLIHHSWWMETDDGFEACRPEHSRAELITWMDINELKSVSSRYCVQCVDGEHKNCIAVRQATLEPEIPLYPTMGTSAGRKGWFYDPEPF